MKMQHPNGENFGHGHVFPRKDEVKMRCGGIGLCPVCNHDQVLQASIKENLENRPTEPDLDQTKHKFDMYLHSSKDDNWHTIISLIQHGEVRPMTDGAKENFMYQLCEVKLNVELDIETGNIKILGVNGVLLETDN